LELKNQKLPLSPKINMLKKDARNLKGAGGISDGKVSFN